MQLSSLRNQTKAKEKIEAKENSKESDNGNSDKADGKSDQAAIDSDALIFMQSAEPGAYRAFLPQREPLDDKQQRVAIFIDGSNLFYAALHLSIEIDYAKLLCKLTQGRRLLRAYFYTGVDRANEKQKGFLLWMRRNGYRVVAKELIQHTDGSKKANLDVEIAVDMMQLADHCGTMVLLSGDGDLAYAVNAITYSGVQVEVVSLQSMTSDLLINVADRYTDLASIREEIQKKW
jgi:uncharacterized LabA/DUF88 family protein